MRRAERLDDVDVPRLLADRAEALVAELLPGGKRHGHWYRAGSIAGEAGQSLAVCLVGPRRGRWRDYADIDMYGDLVDLVAFTRTNRDLKAAFAWSREWLGLGTGRPVPAEIARARQAGAARRARDDAAAGRRDSDNREIARHIWDQARPLKSDDPVDRYLKGRGIDLRRLGRAPAALRYVPSLWQAPGRRFPAMVAAITDGASEFRALHRTWLAPQPDGRVVKAPVTEAKKTLGLYRGGSIKLWRGGSEAPWSNMSMHSTVVCAEGVEDALSAVVAAEIGFPGRLPGIVSAPVAVSRLRVIAAVSLDNIAALELPCQVERLVLLQQRDPPGSPAAQKLAAIVGKIENQGIEVLLAPPPAWAAVKDLNDVVRVLSAA